MGIVKRKDRKHYSPEAQELVDAALAGIRRYMDTILGARLEVEIVDNGPTINLKYTTDSGERNTLSIDFVEF